MWKNKNMLFLNRTTGWPFISIVFSPSVDREKLPARLITSLTVLFLIFAGSPLADINTNTAGAASNPYSPDTTPPASITNLQNTTYAQTYINWTWIDPSTSDFSRVIVYLNGIFQINVSKGVRYYNATGLVANTQYTISTHTVDTSGNINQTWINHSARTAPIADTTPPIIIIASPQNILYNKTIIPLNVSANEVISNWFYSLNGGANITFTPNTTITASQGSNNLIVYASDTAGNWNSSQVYFSTDTTPPDSITNLINASYAYNYINWTWTDPSNPDFDKVMVYLNGTFQTNVTNGTQYYNATSLIPSTAYELNTRTVDLAGNINQTWINYTAITAPSTPAPRTITVNASGGADYTRIYDAVNASNNGYTIVVAAGNYNENVVVNKSINLVGAGAGVTIVNGSIPNNYVFNITTNYVNISGFTITSTIGSYSKGIYLNRANYANISNNTLWNNNIGIQLEYANNNNLVGNRVLNNDGFGIHLYGSGNNNLTGNTVLNNGWNGIYLDGGNNNLTGNIVKENNGSDIELSASYSSCNYINNIITNNIGSGDRPIKYFDKSVNLQNEILSELILCSADNSNINNVTIEGSITKQNNGFYVIGTDNSNFSNINSSGNYIGITLRHSNNNALTNNTANSNKYYGISLQFSNNNTLGGNIASNNNAGGIVLEDDSRNNILSSNNASNNNNGNNAQGIWISSSSNNTLISNDVSYNNLGIYLTLSTSNNNTLIGNIVLNNGVAIILDSSSNNIIRNNNASNNGVGIYLFESSNSNTINDNTANSNWRAGIFLNPSNNNILNSNNVSNNEDGILLASSSNNIVSSNKVSNNNYGIYLVDSSNNRLNGSNVSYNYYGFYQYNSSNNTIYNNYFNNINNNFLFIGTIYSNTWNTTKTSGTNIIGGSYVGGNFWANPSGTGFSQTCTDVDRDGICDSPYVLDANNTDFLPLAASISGPRTITVNASGGADYTRIQDAVNAASNGDTITVAAGTYNENVVVNKSVNLVGAGEGVTIVNALNPNDHVFNVTANNVNISRFTVTGATGNNNAGIYLAKANYANISSNKALYNFIGIYLTLSSNNMLNGNTATLNNFAGFYLASSSNNMLSGNNASNTSTGIALDHSNSNTLKGNIANLNYYGGIYQSYSNNNILNGNTADMNEYYGIYMGFSSSNTLNSNVATLNKRYGIWLASSNNNMLGGNIASKNVEGIRLDGSSNTLNNNIVSDNNYGISLLDSDINIVYNNYFNNTNNSFDSTIYSNYWNITKQAGTNIIEGSYLGGNFWANPSGTGFSQTCTDADRDGICDSPYVLDANNTDYLPLAAPASIPIQSPINWTKYSGNPLNLENSAYFPSVLFDGINYKMWYALNDEIYYATSIDGVAWTKYGKVLSKGASGSWEQTVIRPQTVIYDGSIYKMWYEGSGAIAQLKIGYATSSDGITWTKYSGNPVLIPGGDGGWDDWSVSDASVITDGSAFKMWYGAQGVQYGTNKIGYAVSSDGITWTKYSGNPVLNPGGNGGWDDKHVLHQTVLKDNAGYKMWYIGLDSSDIGRIGYATSPDGTTWTKYGSNPVLNLGSSGAWDDANLNGPFVLFDGNSYDMWFGGYDGSIWRIGFASTSGVAGLRVHNINKGTTYSTIQSAIDDASPGDEIHVDSGTYYENVNVNKQLILRGVDTSGGKPVVNAGGGVYAIKFSSDNITLDGFNITNSNSGWFHGAIDVISSYNTIMNNDILNNYNGIYIDSSRNNNIIVSNNVTNNTLFGIEIYFSNNNMINGNNFFNSNQGIYLEHSNYNNIRNNNVNNNLDGLNLQYSKNNSLTNNIVNTNKYYGISILAYSGNNTLNNNIADFNRDGIDISQSNYNELNGNRAESNSEKGIYLQTSSNYNVLINNIINSNNQYGIFLDTVDSNTIYNNILNNSINFGYYRSTNNNFWNTTKTQGTNIVGGLYLGGNFWANPSGTGFSQTCTDADRDGICDSPYVLGLNNTDYLPLSLNFTIP